MRHLQKFLAYAGAGGNLIGALLFLGLFACLIAQVVARFVLDRPAAWTEETASVLFVWAVFWGAAFVTRLHDHVAMDLLEARLPARVRRVSEAVGLLLLAGCFAWSLPGVLDYVQFMGVETTPVIGLPFSWVDAVFVLFVGMIALRALVAVVRPPEQDAPEDINASGGAA